MPSLTPGSVVHPAVSVERKVIGLRRQSIACVCALHVARVHLASIRALSGHEMILDHLGEAGVFAGFDVG